MPKVSRRKVLAIASSGAAMLTAARTKAQAVNSGEVPSLAPGMIKALVFDVFGTVVDWRASVAAEVDAFARRRSLKIDPFAFADAWRAGYPAAMNQVRSGALPWIKLDDLHRMILERLLVQFNAGTVPKEEIDALNRAWHRLRPWPDAAPGLTRLKRRFVIAPLSNGNISLITNMAKAAGLPWDCVLGAELVRHYKPDREVYLSAAEFLDLEPGQVMMVAAHLSDLRAAKALGLATAFVPRPQEYGPGGRPEAQPDASVDITARDFNDLAERLDA